jgi:hypothetical protein
MNPIRHSIGERVLLKAWLAVDVALWLSSLPALLRVHTIPTLLKRLGASERQKAPPRIDLNDAVKIVTRVCSLRPFRARFFPKLCLRQSLVLYRTLSRLGYPVEIHFGVKKDGRTLHGHSWVTLQGEPLADTAQHGMFRSLYSYRSNYAFK